MKPRNSEPIAVCDDSKISVEAVTDSDGNPGIMFIIGCSHTKNLAHAMTNYDEVIRLSDTLRREANLLFKKNPAPIHRKPEEPIKQSSLDTLLTRLIIVIFILLAACTFAFVYKQYSQ